MERTIKISIRGLYARTGHYVRKAAKSQRVVITDCGKPVAELPPSLPASTGENPWKTRGLRADFQQSRARGAFRPRLGDRDITLLISEERD